MLTVEHLRFSYKHGDLVLKDVSFDLDFGDCLCLLGPNGTGKTTLLKCLLNHQKPDGGRILLDGRDICCMTSRERAARLAYVSQSTGLSFPYSVEEVVLMGRVAHMRLGASISKKDRSIAYEVMDRMGIMDMKHKNFQILSGGERQMVLIARALTQQANYLILDEPTAALDYSNQVKILDMIRNLSGGGYGILMTSHFPDHAFLACNKAVLMRDGGVMAFGTPDQVVTSDNLTELYRIPVVVTEAALENKGEQAIQRVCVPVIKRRGNNET